MYHFINKYSSGLLLATIALSFILHIRFVNTDLRGAHVWRQTQTQTNINSFAYEDFNILNPKRYNNAHTDRIYRMEFPIMQWLFAIFYKLFGDHIAISRILSFLIGTCSVIGIFFLAKTVFNNKVIAFLSAWTLSFSPAFYYFSFNPCLITSRYVHQYGS